MTDPFPRPSRRAVLAAGAVLSTAGAVSASAAIRLDLTDPAQRLRAYLQMRGALDDRLVIGGSVGRYYGVVDEAVKPLYGFVAATFSRYRPAPGGGYEGATYEVPYFTDLATGEVMDHWLNPYTGEEVEVSQTAYPPARIVIGTDLSLSVPKPVPGLAMADRVLEPLTSEDDVWMTEETFTALTIPGAPKTIRFGELTTLHARRSDLAAPGAKRVACETAFTAVVSWRPWLKMGDRPGHLMGVGSGRYGVPSIDSLSGAWRRATAARRPEVLKDPSAAIAKLFAQT